MSDAELRTRIIEAARLHFFEHGFSKSTMEELAQTMGMSKKTIYKFFPGKEDLIREITREKLTAVHATCLRLQGDRSIDFMERIRTITGFISKEMRALKPQFYVDLQRTMPELWKEVEEFRTKRVLEDFSAVIREGIALGVFRNDINVEVLVMMYSSAMQSIINPETLSQLPLNSSQAYEAIVEIIFGGVFTPAGKERYAAQLHTHDTTEAHRP